jgi:arabinan endo-1,5-alpha-L-arabinosidase
MRWWIARRLAVGFYGSIGRGELHAHQERHGVRVAWGPGWIHLGWIADPERERYVIERRERGHGDSETHGDGARGGWRECGRARLGSFLFEGAGGEFRVCAVPRAGFGGRAVGEDRVLGVVSAEPEPGPAPPICRPAIDGPWRPLFRPREHGRYVNDHTIYRDATGRWRLLGITSHSDGDFDAERWLAAASSDAFPPPASETMREEPPVADFGELAWAPHVVRAGARWYLFWSPHRLHQMSSPDGIHWQDPRVTLDPPRHRFFRDTLVLEAAPGQWLLYATARGRYYSRVDCYQSFDLEHWQYIGPALRTGFGCERASPFASTESPTVVRHEGRFYLALTYNNGSFFWPGLLLLLRRWPGRASYNDTRIFHSENPYDFGVYRGPRRPSREIARLRAHAAELIHHPETGAWWITTAGWPWVATLTAGEVAVAPLRWERPDPHSTSRNCVPITRAI